MDFKPEGTLINSEDNLRYISSVNGLDEAMQLNITLEARAVMCTGEHDLIVELPCGKGIIAREDGALGIKDGTIRDIAVISRVNKPVCFKVVGIEDKDGSVTARLSRVKAQEECLSCYISTFKSGDVIGAKVTHIEQFGAFVDIGCGISSLIPIDEISVSRISDPSDRLAVGQKIKVIVKSVENGRVFLTHKELLGTWEENAAGFSAGETVSGIVRSVENYGIFVELVPNLAGLAEPKENIMVGQSVSVFIKAIIPEKMKVKLVIVDVCEDGGYILPMKYFFEGSHIDEWKYSPDNSSKNIVTRF